MMTTSKAHRAGSEELAEDYAYLDADFADYQYKLMYEFEIRILKLNSNYMLMVFIVGCDNL